MLPFLPDPITSKELAALRLVSRRPTTCDIAAVARERLPILGYVRTVLGGLVLTNEGF